MMTTAMRNWRAIFPLKSVVASVVAAAAFMGSSVTGPYGAIAAPAGGAPAVLSAGQIAGRWSGDQFGHGARASCDKGRCRLTIDVSACAGGWCGVLVKEEGTCGGLAMNVALVESRDGTVQFEGNLELHPKAAGYVIQATLWATREGKEGLEIIGDTGKDMMFLRRSFPFQARLARAGAASCSSDEATS